MEAQIDDLIKCLAATKELLTEHSNLIDAVETLRADHASTTEALASAKDELIKTQAGLSAAQLTNVKQADEAIMDKRQELAGILARLDSAKSALGEAEDNVKVAQQRHNQIQASLESLKKQIHA